MSIRFEPKLVKETLTVPEADEVLGIGDTLAWQLVQTGRLRTVKLGRLRLVPGSALNDLHDGRVNNTRYLLPGWAAEP